MIKSFKKTFRLEVAVSEVLKRKSYWWTFTTPDVVDYSTVACRWRLARSFLSRKYKPFVYIQNFELHPKGHGWHVHFITNTFINLKKHLQHIQRFGFGRVHVKKVWSSRVGDYLAKHAWKPVKGQHRDKSAMRVRLVNVSRNLQCSLTRFDVVGGSSGWLSPDKTNKHDSWKNQIIGKTYGSPIVPSWNWGGVVGGVSSRKVDERVDLFGFNPF